MLAQFRDREDLLRNANTDITILEDRVRQLEDERNRIRREIGKLRTVARLLLGIRELPKRLLKSKRTVQKATFTLAIVAAVGAAFWLGGKMARKPNPKAVSSLSVAGPSALLKLCGSNTVGSELAPALAEAFFSQRLRASDIQRVLSHVPDELAVQALVAANPVRTVIEIKAHGSTTGFEGLATGDCDIAMSSESSSIAFASMSSDDPVRSLGSLSSPENEHVLGLDGVAVIVNPHNPVPFLLKSQLKDIFLAAHRNWNQVGGHSGEIHTYCRPKGNSGTYATFKQLALDGEDASCTQNIEDSAQLLAAVAKDPSGIGFVGLVCLTC